MSHFRTQVDFHLRIGLQVILLKYETVAKRVLSFKILFCSCICIFMHM